MPSNASTAKPKQDRRFKVKKQVWVLEDGEIHRGIVAELRSRGKILVDFPDCDPKLCAVYDEDDENISGRKPKVQKPKNEAAPPASLSKKRKLPDSTSPPSVSGRRGTGARRAALRQQQEAEDTMAKALVSARLDGLRFEENRRKAQEAQEQQLASGLLTLQTSGLRKTQALLEAAFQRQEQEPDTPPPSRSIFDDPVMQESGMKFTRV